MKYLPHVLDSELDLRLRSISAALIVGPKWCGKTTTAPPDSRSPDRRHPGNTVFQAE